MVKYGLGLLACVFILLIVGAAANANAGFYLTGFVCLALVGLVVVYRVVRGG